MRVVPLTITKSLGESQKRGWELNQDLVNERLLRLQDSYPEILEAHLHVRAVGPSSVTHLLIHLTGSEPLEVVGRANIVSKSIQTAFTQADIALRDIYCSTS